MRTLLLAATLLAAPPRAAPTSDEPAADWRGAGISAPMREALRGEGYGLQDDGRVLDPSSRLPLTSAELTVALARIDLAARRLALERLRLALSRGPLSDSDRAAAAAFEGNLPEDVARALDAKASLADLKALTDRDLTEIAAYFDGVRTPAERAEAAAPVRAGDPGPRASLPYFDPSERRLGDALRAAAVDRVGRDPFGRRTVLARLDGADGKPDLPPIVVEDLAGGVAEYDYRRRALVLDRGAMAAAAADLLPVKSRGALETMPRQALIGYLNAHPEAVAAFAAQNDALIVHELTHAWQDRRDPVMQEMSRGELPGAVVIDYEEEAQLTKNLYLRSKLERAPSSVADDVELSDYRKMSADPRGWLRDLRANYAAAAPNAMNLATVRDIQSHRLAMARARPVADRGAQAAKSLDLLALERADKEIAAAQARERRRVSSLLGEAERGRASSAALLARYYLGSAAAAPNAVEFSVRLRKAEDYAASSGDAALKAEVRAAKARGR